MRPKSSNQTPQRDLFRSRLENPYYQFFCGKSYFQHQLPIDPSSLGRWRQRIGDDGAQFILQQTVITGLKSEAVKKLSLERGSVDTTVQRKAVRYPTDSRLYNRSRERLVRLAQEYDVPLRQQLCPSGPQSGTHGRALPACPTGKTGKERE